MDDMGGLKKCCAIVKEVRNYSKITMFCVLHGSEKSLAKVVGRDSDHIFTGHILDELSRAEFHSVIKMSLD